MEPWLDPSLGRPKLLLVDDQPINIRALHQLFRFDCDVLMATGGEQAIDICKAQLPDLVLLDVVMDGVDGHEVCRRLKSDSLTRDIPIIFLSANNQEEDEAEGLELGAVDYISKPFNPVIVRARVKTHLTLKLQSDLLRAMAMLDGLTGVANRRKLENRMEAAWAHACREGSPISLIMIDVDYFKKYNDHYGHQAGDQCLRRLAQAVASILNRPYDLLARYGGEEFACLLPDTDQRGAKLVAQKIMAAVADLRIEHLASDVGPYVSLSLGIATGLPAPQLNWSDLLRLADEQLYQAKKNGRARFCGESYGG
ncbi:diguanylate cyclase [Pseudomonas sp. BLCC-B13]|uniref:diguanylate cyclase domain-containing protein n=1 Tax=Pseudomonas sp. BLCC-B13 TaxID=3025314 RepID=UPI00234F9B5D|nr:diguanylate cyclase [Pseudomonas sp. BLCC-B13]MDC7825005.1 diguanylate cyclase [Pseudomonas sp. BLCC-B13]